MNTHRLSTLFSGLKINNTSQEKYLNAETGRKVQLATAEQKKYISHEWKICSNNKTAFRKELEKKDPSLKRKSISMGVKVEIWRRDYGNKLDAKCYVCRNTSITLASAECGHIIAHSRGGSSEPNNLRMICKKCNRSMGTMHMGEYKAKLKT